MLGYTLCLHCQLDKHRNFNGIAHRTEPLTSYHFVTSVGGGVRPNPPNLRGSAPVYNTFLPRDAMRKRDLCFACCPSVCPSVRLVDYIHTAVDNVNFFFGPVVLLLLVFLVPCAGTRFQGEPL